MSGFFLSFSVLNQLKRLPVKPTFKDKIKAFPKYFLVAFFHRVYRILPTMAFCLLINWEFIKYITMDSPIKSGFLKLVDEDCGSTWWKKLLFIDNWVNPSQDNICLP